VLKVQIESFKPDMVLSFGVANQREQLEIEKIAINFRSSKNEDTLGYQPKDEPIIEWGPDGVFSNLNVSELVSDLTQQQIKIGVSYSAGTYVCNSLMYELCLDSKKNNYLAGFIHTPNNWQEDKLLNSVLKLIDSAKRIHFKNF
jgi:pyroglutamyl-peptidase